MHSLRSSSSTFFFVSGCAVVSSQKSSGSFTLNTSPNSLMSASNAFRILSQLLVKFENSVSRSPACISWLKSFSFSVKTGKQIIFARQYLLKQSWIQHVYFSIEGCQFRIISNKSYLQIQFYNSNVDFKLVHT
jgi:hypothetical protein